MRKSVNSLSSGRHSCSQCRRALLTGERLYVFRKERREARVCGLCLSAKPEGYFGEPVSELRIHANERSLQIRAA